MSDYEICQSLSDLVRNMVKSYDRLALDNLMRKYGNQAGKEIFDFVMNNENGYRVWRAERINRIYIYINDKNYCFENINCNDMKLSLK